AKKVIEKIEKSPQIKNSQIVRILQGQDTEFLLYAMALSKGDARQAISRYITELSRVKPEITGDDLKRLGFTPGPLYRNILESLREERLDGRIHSKEQELEFVKKKFGEHPT
ncbi:MAG: polya polymerase, partial [Thermodesulfobacteria bacterium]|nr:polya polymerase [Thermodesulfobacteriota bacterium]